MAAKRVRTDNEELRVCFIGAGAVNFGGAEGPWDHSRRLELLGGVLIVAIVDPDTPKAEAVLQRKLNGSHSALYRECKIFADCTIALKKCQFDVAFVGETQLCWCT